MDISAVDPSMLPSLSLDQRNALPDCPAIYFVLSPDDVVLYIGKTVKLMMRWKAHHRYRQCAAIPGVRIAWLSLTDTPDLLNAIEQACIEYFEPTFNRQHLPNIEDIKRSVRFPVELYRRLEQIAKKEHRSVASQIVAMLEDSVKRYDKKDNDRGNSEPILMAA